MAGKWKEIQMLISVNKVLLGHSYLLMYTVCMAEFRLQGHTASIVAMETTQPSQSVWPFAEKVHVPWCRLF